MELLLCGGRSHTCGHSTRVSSPPGSERPPAIKQGMSQRLRGSCPFPNRRNRAPRWHPSPSCSIPKLTLSPTTQIRSSATRDMKPGPFPATRTPASWPEAAKLGLWRPQGLPHHTCHTAGQGHTGQPRPHRTQGRLPLLVEPTAG